MNVLIIFAHPEQRSLNGTIKNAAVAYLEAAGHQVEVSDLYQMNWKSAVDGRDYLHHQPEDRLFVGNVSKVALEKQALAPDIVAEQEKILRADLIIFQFPLWWFSMPAILKGWVDRVFTKGFGYGAGKRYGGGKFLGKKGMLIVTAGSDTHSFSLNGINGHMDDLLFPIHHGIMWYSGITPLQPFIVYNSNHISEAHVAETLQTLKARIDSLETLDPIHYYSITAGDYDENDVLKTHLRDNKSGLAAHRKSSLGLTFQEVVNADPASTENQ
ncbi:MAG: NAD(P)H-dependent oxidoreductase [Chitinophaga sp.]|uniref:NAD(P)H-dependent oxidoreductase n=1 Tax=Chitinophaga sp. TaxID=1869181 RepID=UPI0025BC933C|nr:NAD(P)H-dependent oxidoreductase [Chitinophaga sp.]MBV8253295.1 NAD(P)H-dependent oxidoreductase [Chitinophaga sp.]